MTGDSRTMLITGATGFIGARLATLALAQGYRVKTLTRSDWAGTPAVPIDDRYFGALPEQIPGGALQQAQVVAHCAASVDTSERRAYAINVEGTRRLASAARDAGVQTFLFLSSQSARPDAISAYGRTKYAAEQALGRLEGMNIIILRPGLVTGPGSRGLYQRLRHTAESLPVIPLLGGGRSIVQPIHIDDLCDAIFRCDRLGAELHGQILNLGHPEGIPLVEFLRAITRARLGRRKRSISIPLGPVEVAVRLAEKLRIPLPIDSNNLRGLKILEKMETAKDLARLGMDLRPLEEMVREETENSHEPAGLTERAVRVLLIGAGRVGLVHAVTLSRLNGVVLAGAVDSKPQATGLLKGMGMVMPTFQNLEDALNRAEPDAAVIATPVATHLPLTRICLQKKLAVMVEKPLAIQREQLTEYARLSELFPGCPVQVGYVMTRNPQVVSSLNRLRAGEFGNIRGFVGATLLSFIQETSTRRWEVNKSISGGGSLINAGGHVVSMIRAAFGSPLAVEAESLKLHSAGVEDSLVTRFTYSGFAGIHYCTWSIHGYPRQENLLTIWTDRGRLILTGSVGVFVADDGLVDVTHQLDFDVGFNIAPDYAGAGFTAELTDLRDSVRTGRPAPMNLREATELEGLMFHIYDVAREVKTFSISGPPVTSTESAEFLNEEPARNPRQIYQSNGGKNTPEVRRILDLRDLTPGGARAFLGSASTSNESPWKEYLLGPAQLENLPESWRASDRVRVTVPDFLAQSRLLAAGRYSEVVSRMGARGLAAAIRAGVPLLFSERAPTFWVAAMGMLGAALRSVPARFRGTLLLHSYLTDFALSLRRLDVLEAMLRECRRVRPKARVGFHTNMPSEALNALWMIDAQLDEVSVLSSPHARDMDRTLERVRQVIRECPLRVTAEVGLAPAAVHKAAFSAPQRWSFGADSLLIGIGADGALSARRQAHIAVDWTRVFPGLQLPNGIL